MENKTNNTKDYSKLFMLAIILGCCGFLIYNQVFTIKAKEKEISHLILENDSLGILKVTLEMQIDSLKRSKINIKEKIIYVQANRDEKLRIYNTLDTTQQGKFFASWADEEIPDPNRIK